MSLKWPEWFEDIWAKSPNQEEGDKAESLAEHTFNVLHRLSELITLRPDLPVSTNLPDLWNTVFWALFLHDFGKSAKGFQRALRGEKRWPHRHEVLSVMFVDWISDGISEKECVLIVAGIVSHHRDADEISRLYMNPQDPTEDPLNNVVSEIDIKTLEGLWKWSIECCESWISELGLRDKGIKIPKWPPKDQAIQLIQEKGSERIRYWIKQFRQWLKSITRYNDLQNIIEAVFMRGHVQMADHMASADIKRPLYTSLPYGSEILAQLGLSDKYLYDHQRACSKPLNSAILMAPTGSGKTESAVIWALSQKNNGKGIPRLFYTLPYHASMNAMYDRLNSGIFQDMVGLEHSRSVLALYRLLLDDNTPNEAKRKARWAKDLARLHYYPVRILSPYQILKAFYRIKGYESLLTDFFGGAFVFDEIHAYEPKRLGMIMSSIEFLFKALKAKFFVMSATLPKQIINELCKLVGDVTIIKASSDIFKKFERHRSFLLEGEILDYVWLERISKEAINGKSVLVCCNTVKRAQEVYEWLKNNINIGLPVILLHSRFTAKDRLIKEKIVKEASGSRSQHRKPIILVSTQVVEVSMDIDLEVIYTEPAPIEALIQRFGRINRRRLKDWAPVYIFTKPDDGQSIYEQDLVKGALEILKSHNEQIISEEAIPDWLDNIYQNAVFERWLGLYRKGYEEFQSACIDTLRPFASDDSLEKLFYEAFDGIDVLPIVYEDQYNLLKKKNPLEASELLVPIRWRQLSQLEKKGKTKRLHENGTIVVDVPYNNELGLIFI